MMIFMVDSGAEDKDTGFTCKYEAHSNSSMKITGTYNEGMTKEKIEPTIKGTFGGRWEYFQNGRYSYIAYTD